MKDKRKNGRNSILGVSWVLEGLFFLIEETSTCMNIDGNDSDKEKD